MRHFRSIFKTFTSSQMAIVLTFSLAMLVPNLFLIGSEPFTLPTLLANLFLPFGLYLLWALMAPKPGLMILLAVPVMVLGAFQLVVWSIFRGSVVAIDMLTNTYTTNTSEVRELLGNMVLPIIGVCLLYVPLIVLAVRSLKLSKLDPQIRQRLLCVALLSLTVGVVLTIVSGAVNKNYKTKYHIFPINIVYNIVESVERWQDVKEYEERCSDFSYQVSLNADTVLGRKIYVYVIGEASRAASSSLCGYERKTNPLLEQLDNLVVYKNMLTESNTTHKSVPMLLSSASAIDYSTLMDRKSIFALFSEAGFKTMFFSNQARNGSMIDFMAAQADITIYLKDDGNHNHYDGQLVDLVKQAVESSEENLFIALHTYGSHFNFRERYPSEFSQFRPDNYTRVNPYNRDKIVNAYDNSLLYTDYILRQLADLLEDSGSCSAMYYTSDHGEDIYDDKRDRFLHASPIPTYTHLHIFAFTWFSNQYVRSYPQTLLTAEQHTTTALSTASSAAILATMANISSPYVDSSYSPLSDNFTVRDRYYLNDYNHAVEFYNANLTPYDFEAMRRHSISFDSTKVEVIRY